MGFGDERNTFHSEKKIVCLDSRDARRLVSNESQSFGLTAVTFWKLWMEFSVKSAETQPAPVTRCAGNRCPLKKKATLVCQRCPNDCTNRWKDAEKLHNFTVHQCKNFEAMNCRNFATLHLIFFWLGNGHAALICPMLISDMHEHCVKVSVELLNRKQPKTFSWMFLFRWQ